jgi:glycerol-3-phosphate dehydrogenase
MATSTAETLDFDIVVIGGGVAGLWIANRLHNESYRVIVLEQQSLGRGQSIASQGMIHGGVKYTLGAALTRASEAIADMPDYWRLCLAGKGDVDLSQTKTLSDYFYMWSTENALSKVTAFLASKALRGRVDALDKTSFPPVFNTTQFKGSLYQLVDSVIDTPSLLRNLADNLRGRVFAANPVNVRWNRQGSSVSLGIEQRDGSAITVQAKQFIFTAGEGNAALLSGIGAVQPQMQVRPLQQVLVKHHHPYPLYAHCIGTDNTPRLTISSHRCQDGATCWYLGGQLAEKGVGKPTQQLMQEARNELRQLFPWLDWQQVQWATLKVNRAEPRQKNLARPDKAYLDRAYLPDKKPLANVLVAWPTKLTLAPQLGNEALALLQQLDIHPSTGASPAALAFLPSPPVAPSPWDVAEWSVLHD